jgi:hypothetical protein
MKIKYYLLFLWCAVGVQILGHSQSSFSFENGHKNYKFYFL